MKTKIHQNKQEIDRNDDLLSIIQILIKVRANHPELRMMQILGNVYGAIDPYYITDEDLLTNLKQFYAFENK